MEESLADTAADVHRAAVGADGEIRVVDIGRYGLVIAIGFQDEWGRLGGLLTVSRLRVRALGIGIGWLSIAQVGSQKQKASDKRKQFEDSGETFVGSSSGARRRRRFVRAPVVVV
jgi:hypothetical protein